MQNCSPQSQSPAQLRCPSDVQSSGPKHQHPHPHPHPHPHLTFSRSLLLLFHFFFFFSLLGHHRILCSYRPSSPNSATTSRAVSRPGHFVFVLEYSHEHISHLEFSPGARHGRLCRLTAYLISACPYRPLNSQLDKSEAVFSRRYHFLRHPKSRDEILGSHVLESLQGCIDTGPAPRLHTS